MTIIQMLSVTFFAIGILSVGGCRNQSSAHQPTVRQSAIEAESNLVADQSDLNKQPTRRNSEASIIGHLKTRDKMITIRTGSDGPLYTVKIEDGEILAVDLPAAELFAKFPKLRNIVERGLAGQDASLWRLRPVVIDDNIETTIKIKHNK